MAPVSTPTGTSPKRAGSPGSKHSSSSRKRRRKFRMPTIQEFLDMKKMYEDKKDPIWVRLEQEMREDDMNGIKPYNEKVGIWLKFLEQLRYYQHCQRLREIRVLNEECGPIWYIELSLYQQNILDDLAPKIRADMLDGSPTRIKKALRDLGMTLKISSKLLMKSLKSCGYDPGCFVWDLYSAIYQQPPSILKQRYDINGRLLMSSLVYIDLEECLETLDEITKKKPNEPDPVVQKKKKKQKPINTEFGAYLQPLTSAYIPPARKNIEQKKKFEKIEYKFKLRSPKSFENLKNDTEFLQKRKDRLIRSTIAERECDYKFITPRVKSKSKDTKRSSLQNKMRMLEEKAKIKAKSQLQNLVYVVGSAHYPGNIPNFNVEGMKVMPTEYVCMSGGHALYNGPLTTEYIPLVAGFSKPRVLTSKPVKCDCLSKWEDKVMDVVQNTKCMCGHLYDSFFTNFDPNRKKPPIVEPYVVPPNKYGQIEFDEPLIYQLHPSEDFMKGQILRAIRSERSSILRTYSTTSGSSLPTHEILLILLADFSNTPLIIPHLPKANFLNNLRAWVRYKFFGKLTPEQHQKLKYRSEIRWMWLRHIDFRAIAYRIPFTRKQKKHLSWNNVSKIRALAKILLEDYTTRNRIMQLEHSRLLWATMMSDEYPSKSFLNFFFTLMPSRLKDTNVLNPYYRIRVRDVSGPPCGRRVRNDSGEFKVRF